jgi:hypothetical protein
LLNGRGAVRGIFRRRNFQSQHRFPRCAFQPVQGPYELGNDSVYRVGTLSLFCSHPRHAAPRTIHLCARLRIEPQRIPRMATSALVFQCDDIVWFYQDSPLYSHRTLLAPSFRLWSRLVRIECRTFLVLCFALLKHFARHGRNTTEQRLEGVVFG